MGAFDNFGKTSIMRGLAYANNYDQDIANAIRMNTLQTEKQHQNEQKARYYAEKLKEGVANDELNSKRLETYYDQLNSELGDFVMNAPENWEQNILFQKQFNAISDKYLNNPILAESQRVKMEMEKMYNDKNMTPDWIEQNMKVYEEYKNQYFDPENPDAELDHKFAYGMRPTVGIDQAVANVSKNMGLRTWTDIGDGKYMWQKTEATEEQINSAVSQLMSNPEYKYSLDVSWNNYKEARAGNAQLNIYQDKLEYATALVQNTVPIQEIMKGINPTYEYKLKEEYQKRVKGIRGGGISVPSKSWTMMQMLQEEGEVMGNADLLAYTGIDKNGVITWTPGAEGNKDIAYIDGLGGIEKLSLSGGELGLKGVNHMIVENAHRIFIDPATGRPMVEATVSIPVTSEDSEKMKKYGFRDVNPETTSFSRRSGQNINISFDEDQKTMMGKIYLPADLTNNNNHWEYMDWGFDQKSRAQFVSTQHVPTLSKIAGQQWYDWKFDEEGERIRDRSNTRTSRGEYTEEVEESIKYLTKNKKTSE